MFLKVRLGSVLIAALLRCFILTLVATLGTGAYAASDLVLFDGFEDNSTWRSRLVSGADHGAWFANDFYLGCSKQNIRSGLSSGVVYFSFDEKGEHCLSFTRALVSGIRMKGLSEVLVDIDPCDQNLAFEVVLKTANGGVYVLDREEVVGEGWRTLSFDVLGVNSGENLENAFIQELRVYVSGEDGTFYIDNLRGVGIADQGFSVSVLSRGDSIERLYGSDIELNYRITNNRGYPLVIDVESRFGSIDNEYLAEEGRRIIVEPYENADLLFTYDDCVYGAYFMTLKFSGDGDSISLDDYAVRLNDDFGTGSDGGDFKFGIQDLVMWQSREETILHNRFIEVLELDVVKVFITGEQLQPSRGRTRGERFFKVIDEYGDLGLEVSVLYTHRVPGWTQFRSSARTVPDDWKGFSEHSGLVGRLLSNKTNVRYVEFWNEPNSENYFVGTEKEYSKMLSVFATGIKSNSSYLRVVSGGLSGPSPYIDRSFGPEVAKVSSVDLFGYHSHGGLASYQRDYKKVLDLLGREGRRTANTETGEISFGAGASALNQAVALIQKFVYSMSNMTDEYLIWFTLQDYSDMDIVESGSYGLITVENSPKPSFASYYVLLRALRGTKFLSKVNLGDSVRAYAFTREGPERAVVVVWLADRVKPHTLQLRTEENTGSVKVIDAFGKEKIVYSENGYVEVEVGWVPLYLFTGTTRVVLDL
ncbi:hypothetical protein [Pelagicoccus sp. SDUM812002]|uniref:hypothetical protein n=1 Tax=Pelagicoccus sp. SDUM812002 TaxID=3041266 RepID=UPI00280CF0DB|nr:hypothetical protein [Pelagicoccus sp. SDUM812002]MDQ8188160.1 hypothetical protein [Pelagicoccus sp. SDUM812002]